MHIELSEHFTYSKLLRFTFPSIIMMVLNSIYGVVDGFLSQTLSAQSLLLRSTLSYRS